jgi:hypothetical protein
MGQGEIYKFLKKDNNWYLSSELIEEFKMSPGGMYRLLRVLERNKDIMKKKAIEVIGDKERLKKSSKKAWAFKIK